MTITIDDLLMRRHHAMVTRRERAESYLKRKVIPGLAKRPLMKFITRDNVLVNAAIEFGLTFTEDRIGNFYISIPERKLLKD